MASIGMERGMGGLRERGCSSEQMGDFLPRSAVAGVKWYVFGCHCPSAPAPLTADQ